MQNEAQRKAMNTSNSGDNSNYVLFLTNIDIR